MEPMVQVTAIGQTSQGTGSGGQTIIADTPNNMPNVAVRFINPIVAVAVRFATAFLTTLSGLVLAGMVSDVIPAKDFLDLVLQCSKLSIAGAGVGLIKDLITIFKNLEGKYPLLTGSV